MDSPALADALGQVTGALPHHEERPSQRAMAEAVGRAIATQRHLIVAAGTGTGKSLAYLVPAVAAGSRAVIATATKALQDQLATHDLPLLVGAAGAPVEFAVLKGRSNYLCRQRAAELAGGDSPEQLVLDDGRAAESGPLGRELRRLIQWAETAGTGDRAELPWEPSPAAWAQVSVGPRDCPGAARCPSGPVCFAEAARQRAAQADVVVVNTHLYATHLAAGGEILPPHDLVVFDEAHELEDIASASLGFELAGGRFAALARLARPLLHDHSTTEALEGSGVELSEALAGWRGRRLTPPLDPSLAEALGRARERVQDVMGELRRRADGEEEAGGSARARRIRAQQAATHLVGEIDALLGLDDRRVAWVEGPDHAPLLRVAPLDVGAALAALLWERDDAPTAVCTSATIPMGLAGRIGLPAGSFDELDVGSPFDYPAQALLYCPLHLPDPRRLGYEAAMHDELVALIEAAGGRTLALFTSWKAMQRAAEALRARIGFPLLTQSDLPKPALVERFSTDERSCLFATMGFWQGVDVPGRALSLVTIDRLPFPRPDDPLLQARRDRLGRDAFALIDVPRAATMLAQGAGRLIRSRSDRGVVAVLDPRLGRARYRWSLIRALPPMRRSKDRAVVTAFLREMDASG
ncbi:MAG: ATP-dependent DNA helicase [Acidimicrobiales bacterium]